ncbi:MAG: MBL fold metallo-hydrolase [Streptomycetaceae bacterium]|nr:MBL fold metallo-hydrolase [Streptomycetaceae bacterium]
MTTTVHEIADGVHRISTYVPDIDFTFNQFLVLAEEPLLFHAGPRLLFPDVAAAVGRVLPVERLRWISFGHVEADELGAMNQWLAAAPHATVAHGRIAVAVSLLDLADRQPRVLADGEVLDLGGRRVRWIDTPHLPHGWEAGLLFEAETRTLMCGDLFTAVGDGPPVTGADPVGPALAAEETFAAGLGAAPTCLTPTTGPTVRTLADLDPAVLAVMHGPSFHGDCPTALRDLADGYDTRLRLALEKQ